MQTKRELLRQFSLYSTQSPELYTGVPEGYSGPVLPGGEFFSAVSDAGQVIVQELSGDHYILRYNVFRFLRNISFKTKSANQGVYGRFMIKSSVQQEVNGTGKMHLSEGQYTLILSYDSEFITRFEKDSEYRSLDIFFSPRIFHQLACFFPELETVFALQPDHPLLFGNTRRMNNDMKDIIREILECSFDPASSRFYFDLKIREFLYLLVNDNYNTIRSPRLRLSPSEREAIEEARALLLKDISQKPLTIPELAKKISVNEFKLKKGFREIFGMSIFECLLEVRMEKARELLLATDLPIKAICIRAGYPRITNFITAFRRRYGYTPGSMRRKNLF